MADDEYYYDLTDKERNKAVSFLLQSILKTKAALADTANQFEEDSDEDVNIYLAHLMFAVTTPEYRHVAERYLSPYSTDIDRMVDEAEDHYVKYFIYKVNADHLLIHLGIFQDLGQEAPRSHTVLDMTEEKYSGRATAYYNRAADFNHRIYRKQTAVGTVLGKLSGGFNKYRDILRAARRDFFHFSNIGVDDQFAQFVSELERFEKETALGPMQDELLDLYSEWLKSKNPSVLQKLDELSKK